MTPFDLLHLFIYDSTSRHYSIWLQCVTALWCCVSERSLDLFSVICSLISLQWLYLGLFSLSVSAVFSLLSLIFLCTCVKVKVKVTLRLTVSQPVSLGVEPHLGLMTRYLAITVWQLQSLFLWGALSDERTGLSFVYAAGPCQCNLSRVRVPWYLRPYFTVSDLRLPFSSRLTTRRDTVEVFDPASTRFSIPVSYLSPLKYGVCVWNRRHLLSRLHFPLLRFRNNLVA
jgi:hypothetical protein